jgi:hypothetical protein
VGKETPETPAFAESEMELAGIGTLASLELYQSTRCRAHSVGSGDIVGAPPVGVQTALQGKVTRPNGGGDELSQRRELVSPAPGAIQ